MQLHQYRGICTMYIVQYPTMMLTVNIILLHSLLLFDVCMLVLTQRNQPFVNNFQLIINIDLIQTVRKFEFHIFFGSLFIIKSAWPEFDHFYRKTNDKRIMNCTIIVQFIVYYHMIVYYSCIPTIMTNSHWLFLTLRISRHLQIKLNFYFLNDD